MLNRFRHLPAALRILVDAVGLACLLAYAFAVIAVVDAFIN